MSPELEKKLYDKYPKIFAQRHLSIQESCMAWGIETGDGWYGILNQLCSLIQGHVDWARKRRASDFRFNRALARALKGDKSGLIHYHKFCGKVTNYGLELVERDIAAAKSGRGFIVPHAKLTQIRAIQVKEKFGTLRFYTNATDEYIKGLISMAEAMSSITCETCGTPGKMRSGGWIHVACDSHAASEDLT